MSTKRPYSSEGHLGLSKGMGTPLREHTVPLLAVDDGALAAFGIREGDRVMLNPRGRVEHGDVAALREEDGAIRLWKAYPQRDGLRLSRGDEQRSLSSDSPLEGIVVAILRRLGS